MYGGGGYRKGLLRDSLPFQSGKCEELGLADHSSSAALWIYHGFPP